MGFLLNFSPKSHLLFFFWQKTAKWRRYTSHKKRYILRKLSLYYMGFLLNFSLKSHILSFFDKKHKSTDWCSIEGGVPSDGENRVHCLYFAVFTYAQLAARFPIGNCHLFAWNRNRNRHFFSGIPESQNPSGVSRIPATFLPGILLES